MVKQFKNKNYCHTHGYKCVDGHDSAHCMYPEKGHKVETTMENPMGGCVLYKWLYTSYCLEVGWWCGMRERNSETSIIRKLLKVANKKKSEINTKLKSILLSSCHTNKNKSVGFANIREQKLFCSNNEPNFPTPPSKNNTNVDHQQWQEHVDPKLTFLWYAVAIWRKESESKTHKPNHGKIQNKVHMYGNTKGSQTNHHVQPL